MQQRFNERLVSQALANHGLRTALGAGCYSGEGERNDRLQTGEGGVTGTYPAALTFHGKRGTLRGSPSRTRPRRSSVVPKAASARETATPEFSTFELRVEGWGTDGDFPPTI